MFIMNDALIRFQRGFTLIELLVVISIIGLLSSVVLASVSASRASARDAERIANLKQIQNALELYALDNNGNYPNFFARSSNGSGEGAASGCGLSNVWCNLETTLASYIKKLPRTYIAGTGIYHSYTYKIPVAPPSNRNPNNLTFYGLGVRLENPNTASRNDGGVDPNYFELGQLPKYCSQFDGVTKGKTWYTWTGIPCDCLVSADDAVGGSSCGL